MGHMPVQKVWFRKGIRAAVTWLHHRAETMNDDNARGLLNGAAFNLGSDFSATSGRAPMGLELAQFEAKQMRTQIDRLRAENERLRGALRPFARLADMAQAEGITPMVAAWENGKLIGWKEDRLFGACLDARTALCAVDPDASGKPSDDTGKPSDDGAAK